VIAARERPMGQPMEQPMEQKGWRVLLSLGILVVVASCQRAGMEPPTGPAPTTAEPRDEGVMAGDGAIPAIHPLIAPLGPAKVEMDELDPILHTAIAHDALMRERAAFWADFWTTRSRSYFERYLERMGQYQHLVDRELEERGLPPSLRYLPIVESGYHHGVTSRAGATGLWQLMPATARGLGLLVDGVVDDRRDPVGSTTAALDYLEELYAQFDSWALALSAYNAGPGRVGRLLDQHVREEGLTPDERYLRVRSHLPAETREFVPRFFAAAILASDPERYGFAPIDTSRSFLFDEVVVPDATSLDVIARAAGVPEAEIVELNAHYTRGFTPAGHQRVVRVPAGTAPVFEVNFAQVPPEERISFVEHVVARGETLSHIARRYGVTVAELTGANGGLDPRRLQIGQRLVVSIAGNGASGVASSSSVGGGSGTTTTTSATAAPAANGGPDNGARQHTVAAGENLWTIARRHGVSVSDLQRWNGLRDGQVLRPGQELSVGAGARLHPVAPGDTWSGIARRYGVATSALARANGRTTGDVIRVGEELLIP
jgi:membrane-bound lytic murein transglycosylase D